jgi:branched-chain amino acid transport system substrate-binding protein
MPGYDALNTDYQAVGFPNYGDEAQVWGAYAYDAAKIIIAAIDRADSADPTTIRDEIAATGAYNGVVGTYAGFDSKGDVIPQWAWLQLYRNGEWVMEYPNKMFLPLVLDNYQ